MKGTERLSVEDIDRIVEMAWEDRTPFDLIELQFGLKEKEVIKLMRKEMKSSSFRMWRKRVNERSTKHKALRSKEVKRFRSPLQKTLTY
ncbi:TIGR03643 family protein [Salisediminibacterium beveridgei]|uniref:Alcohol dehydrogenase, class IV n=1 Tax=Salisediminibacterium beveridgei TaxID=632773 RepID=A0A1D7QYJ0_9BACI|nr:TIGR03643 family protein [Salisediminibacterium beveridgei]AOM84076.1 Alcohol dehydrogenase, class IV [Salisediminibacterium beveridgei]